MTDSLVVTERRGAVALVTLDVPARRNVLSAPLVAAIGAAFDAAEADASVRCVVLTGAGPAFCAGAELATLTDAAGGDFGPVREVYQGFLRVLACPLPVIAAVRGPAVGAGFNLALACDLRLAGDSACFDTRFAGLELHPGGGHTWLLTRAVGPQQAMLACLYGEVWDAREALGHGLVAAVHPDAEVVERAVALGERLAGHSAQYVRRVTATLRTAAGGAGHAEVLERETAEQQWSLGQPEFLTAVERIRRRIGGAGRPDAR